MRCLCPTNTLRLFIRSLAPVELPPSNIRTTHTQWQKTAIRSFSSIYHELRRPYTSKASEDISSLRDSISLRKPTDERASGPQGADEAQTGNVQAEGQSTSGKMPTTREASRKLRKLRRQGTVPASEMTSDEKVEGESSAVKRTTAKAESRNLQNPKRRGVLATDVTGNGQVEEESTLTRIPSVGKASRKKLRKAGPSTNAMRKARRYGDVPVAEVPPVIREIGRRKEVYISGPRIHYSAPLVPVAARATKPDTKSNTKPSESTTEKTGKEKKEDDWKPPPREHWMLNKEALKAKFPEGWKPLKKLSPDAIAGIRAIHAQDPILYTTAVLAGSFQVSPEAMRRILKGNWSPNADEETDRQRRWLNRGKSVYKRYVELGVLKPPRKWRDMGIGKGKPEWMVTRGEMRKRGQGASPAWVMERRARDQKREIAARREEERKRRKAPLPALVTTRRVRSETEREGDFENMLL